MVEITSEEQNKVKRMKRTEIISETSGTISKAPTLELLGSQKKKKKRKGYQKIFDEIIVENFPNMEKEIISQVEEAQRVPYRLNPRRNMPRHILIKLTKTKRKERLLKATREKQQVTYKGNPIHLTADQKLQARKEWQDIFNILKGENPQPRLLYLARISLRIDREIKSFSDKQKN